MGKFFAGVSTRRARVAARKGLVLREIGVSTTTQKRYSLAIANIIDVAQTAESFEALDDLIANWIQDSFTEGEPLNTVADCLSGLHHFIPMTRKRLPVSWRLFGIWRRHEVPSRAPPITADLILGMSSYHLQSGDFTFGALILLAFHCFLRTGEIFQLRSEDFLLGKNKGIVSLPRSKGGVRHNTRESITIEDVRILEVLGTLLEVQKELGLGRVPLWTKSPQAFRVLFYKTCAFFHVTHLGFRCYSLRRGGATAYFQHCGQMERTLLRGRWSSSNVAKIYLCDALSQLPSLKAKPATARKLAKYLPFFQR